MTDQDFYDRAERMLMSEEPADVSRAETMLRERADECPDDALAHFLVASAFDGADREAAAMEAYERVRAIGVERLPVERQPQYYVQAGSTLRNLGRFDAARSLLETGIDHFPGYRALRAFLALVDVSAGRERAAIDHLLWLVTSDDDGDTSLRDYRRALTWYASELAAAHRREGEDN